MLHITPDSVQYVIRPSGEEVKEVIDIIKRFEQSLLEVAAPQPSYAKFFFGVLPDKIVWMGDSTETYVGPKPSMGGMFDFEVFSSGKMTSATADEVYDLIFNGTNRSEILEALIMALLWERDRVTNGEDPEVHLATIEDKVGEFVNGVWANCKLKRRGKERKHG